MKTFLSSALGVGSLFMFAACSSAQMPAPATEPVPRIAEIVTSASGDATYTPDRAVLQIAVQTRALTAAEAGRQNAALERAVFDTLRALGFAQEQLATSNYSVQPTYRYDKDGGAPKVVDYVVMNTVRVDVRKLDLVGQAIDASLAKGANQISGLDFYSSNDDAARRSALAVAVARARGDAEAMARAAGGSLGRLLEMSSSAQVSTPRAVMAMARAAGADATPVSPGESTAIANVSARWEFIPR